MRIDASALAAEGLCYRNARQNGLENEVVLGPCIGVTGFYERSPSGHVVDAKAASLELQRARWAIGAGAVSIDEATRLRQVALRLDIPTGDARLSLHLGVGRAEIAGLLYVAEGLSISASVLLEGALVERDASGGLRVVAISASLRDVEIRAGATKLHAATVKARRVALLSEGKALQISIESVDLTDVRMASGDATVQVARLEAARGLRWHDGHLEFEELTLEGVVVTYDVPAPADGAKPAPASAAAYPGLPDLPALDQLDGHLAVDLRVHATLPILKELGATHALRVPIDGGAISFGELEGNFSAVVDALLDFEVEGDELKLELDVLPIVKFDNVTLLSWKLVDAIDRKLAAQKSIRLRRLLQFERTSSKESKPSKRHDQGAIRLLGIDFDAIAIELSARAPMILRIAGGTACFDDGEGQAIRSLSARGGIHLAIDGESKVGQIDVQAKGIAVLLQDLALGSMKLASAKVTIATVEGVHAAFEGIRPTRIEGKVPSLRVTGASLRIGE